MRLIMGTIRAMSGQAAPIGYSGFLGKAQLMKLKKEAIRRHVWFTSLQRIDRVLVDLTIRVGTNVRSAILAKSILTVARKLHEVFQNKLVHAVNQIGVPLARKLSQLAQAWGNKTARAWTDNTGYARYLTIMRLNG